MAVKLNEDKKVRKEKEQEQRIKDEEEVLEKERKEAFELHK